MSIDFDHDWDGRAAALAQGLTAPIDEEAAERAVSDLLTALGVDLDDPSLRDTPGRVARMYGELLTPRPFNVTTFPNDGSYDELVVVRDIPFSSLCEHHLMPFTGVAHVALPARASASSGSPSWPAWSSSTPAGCRCRSA